MGMYKLTKKEAKNFFENGGDVIISAKRDSDFPFCWTISKKYGTFEEQEEKFKERYNVERPSFWA